MISSGVLRDTTLLVTVMPPIIAAADCPDD
jgi:hypothetical protein